MCGRFYHEKKDYPEAANKYSNKSSSLYVNSTAHALLVKETGVREYVPDSNP